MSDLSASFGVKLDDWQDLVLQAAMGERADGTWAADVVGLSVPRQNGKSQLLVARALAGAILFGETKIIISAHSQDTAREAFSKLLEMRDNSPALDERIDKVMNALNREFVKFKNGAVIQFKARTVSGSRGFSCDCLLLDEAQILGMPAWVSIRSTMSARPNPQAWLLGTPPTPEDNGEVFTAVRKSALTGKTRRTTWLEWASAPGADPSLDETRASANPAWWTRINHEVVQGEYETYPPERFAMDRLGRWMDDNANSVLPEWLNRRTAEPPPSSRPAIGIAVDLDLEWACLGAAAVREDGTVHVSIPEDETGRLDHARGIDWLIPRAKYLQDTHGCDVFMDEKCPDADLADRLREAGVRVTEFKVEQMLEACSSLINAVAEGGVTHFDQPDLNAAVAVAGKRMVSERPLWARKSGDITPLEAITLARFGATMPTREFWGAIG